MRIVMATVLVLFAAGYVASHAGAPTHDRARIVKSQSAATEMADDGWRRSNQGWERSENWLRILPARASRPVKNAVHPLALAAVQMLAVTGLWLLTRFLGKRHEAITRQTEGEPARARWARSTGA